LVDGCHGKSHVSVDELGGDVLVDGLGGDDGQELPPAGKYKKSEVLDAKKN
jgi:hypothetical protein